MPLQLVLTDGDSDLSQNRFSRSILSLCTAFLLPLVLWQALNACFDGRYDNPTARGVHDEGTNILDLQDDTFYIGSLPFLLDPYRFLVKCQRTLTETLWFRFSFCGVSFVCGHSLWKLSNLLCQKTVVVVADIKAAKTILNTSYFSLLDGHMMLVRSVQRGPTVNQVTYFF